MYKIIKAIIGGLFGAVLFGNVAMAANCTAYSYPTFTSGTTAVASQVTSNFSTIMTCANNNLALATLGTLTSPLFTGSVPTLSNGYGSVVGSSTNGGIFTGQGSTNDVSIENKSGSIVMGIPTGTQNTSFSGNVGIGMTPTNILDISQANSSDALISIKNTTNGTGSSAALGTTNSSGNSAVLEMFAAGYSTSAVFRADGGLLYSAGSGGLSIVTGVAQPIYFGVNSAEVARFGTDGSLLVGTTTNGGVLGNAKIAVVSAGGTGISSVDSGSTGQASFWEVNNTSQPFAIFNYQGSNVGSISYNGTLTNFNQTSDARLKNVLKDQRDFGAIIDKIWIGDVELKRNPGHRFLAMLAQQISQYYPDACTPPSNPSAYWQCDYSKLGPLALWGVKDIYKITTKQTAGILDLQNTVKALQAANDNQAAEIHELHTQVSALEQKAGIRTALK